MFALLMVMFSLISGILGLAGIGLVVYGIVFLNGNARFTRTAVRTTGTVVNARTGTTPVYTGTVMIPMKHTIEVVTFTGPHGPIIGEPWRGASDKAPRWGQQVEVLYDPADPSRFAAPRGGTLPQAKGVALLCCGGFLILTGVGLLVFGVAIGGLLIGLVSTA
jgi:hypothetical protein